MQAPKELGVNSYKAALSPAHLFTWVGLLILDTVLFCGAECALSTPGRP